MKAKFQADLQQKLHESPCIIDPSPNILWENLKSAILKTSEEVLGHTKKKKNKDWFDENNKEIQDLLSKKRAAHQAHLAQPTAGGPSSQYEEFFFFSFMRTFSET